MPGSELDKNRRTRVLRVIARLNVGGPSIQAITLSRFLEDRGYETRLLRGREGPREGSMDALAEELDVCPVGVPMLKRDIGLGDVLALGLLVREIRRSSPDILHTHASKAGALGRAAALLAGRKRPRVIVHTFHGHVLSGYFPRRVSALFAAAERLLARVTTCLIAVSEEVRDDLVRLGVAPRDRFVVVPECYDLSRFDASPAERRARRNAFREATGIPLDASVVTLVGRLEPIKRVDRFLRIANRMAGVDKAHFLIVGDGELRDKLQHSAEAQRLGDRLTWAGLRSDMPNAYFASDVLAVTSDNEGTAASAIEAQAARLPVVSTRVGGMSTVVLDGETGALVERRDETAFAAALERLLVNEALAEQLGEMGAEHARRTFSFERLLNEIDELYRRLLYETAGPGTDNDSPRAVDSCSVAIRGGRYNNFQVETRGNKTEWRRLDAG
jgi:glycosyltransferase involved in cell wall biosynthesis